MNFQENRFPIILGTITGIIAIGLIWWGLVSVGRYNEAKQTYDSAVGNIDQLTGTPIYPDIGNRQAKEKAVREYRSEVESLQNAFNPYRQLEFENIEAGDFTNALLAAKKDLAAKFQSEGTEIPADFFLGFEAYTKSTIGENITGVMSYQLEAFTELFRMLASAAPTRLINVHRPQLEEETGLEFDADDRTFREHPIEIAFTGTEETLRKFLSSIDDSEKHYFSVRVLKVSNQRMSAPNATDARFPSATDGTSAAPAPESASPFDGFNFGAETDESGSEVEAPSDTGEILKQVVGDELIEVFVQIDLLQFLEAKPLAKR